MHAEVLDLNRVEWRVIEDYPFSTTEDFCRAPMVYHEAFYIFGGTYRNMNTIGKLDPVRKKWSKGLFLSCLFNLFIAGLLSWQSEDGTKRACSHLRWPRLPCHWWRWRAGHGKVSLQI